MVEANEQPDLTPEAEGQITNTELPAADQSGGAEKRAIVQRLKDYRAASGLGSLEKLSVKTAHNKNQRISADTLRSILTDGALLPIAEWRKIGRALDKLEQEAADA